jgi:imidazolonepropionase-like amidohydrolase
MGNPQKKGSIRKILRFAAIGSLSAVLIALCIIVLAWFSLQPPSIKVPPQGVVLQDVTIVNPSVEKRRVEILSVRGSTIHIISDNADAPSIMPDGGGDMRFAGSYVLPGLIDMHVHYPSRFNRELHSLLYLMHGVTTVREMGNLDDSIFETRKMIDAGEFPGPRIFTGGKIVDGMPPAWPGSMVVENANEAEAAVNRLAISGADFVKVYSNISSESLSAIRQVATEHSLPVVGHPPITVPLEKAGIEDVQHLLGIWPEYYWNKWEDISEDRITEVVQISLERNITHTPTITMWDRLSQINNQDLRDSDLARFMPRYFRQLVWNPETGLPNIRNVPPAEFDELAETIPAIKKIVGRLHRAGVRIHAGTDATMPYVVPGISLHEELYHLKDAGLTTEEVWTAATRYSGDSLGEPMLGTIQAGAPADFLIFAEDPTQDLSALSSLQAVIARGRLYTKEDLDEAYDRHRVHFEGYFYDNFTTAIFHIILNAGSNRAK